MFMLFQLYLSRNDVSLIEIFRIVSMRKWFESWFKFDRVLQIRIRSLRFSVVRHMSMIDSDLWKWKYVDVLLERLDCNRNSFINSNISGDLLFGLAVTLSHDDWWMLKSLTMMWSPWTAHSTAALRQGASSAGRGTARCPARCTRYAGVSRHLVIGLWHALASLAQLDKVCLGSSVNMLGGSAASPLYSRSWMNGYMYDASVRRHGQPEFGRINYVSPLIKYANLWRLDTRRTKRFRWFIKTYTSAQFFRLHPVFDALFNLNTQCVSFSSSRTFYLLFPSSLPWMKVSSTAMIFGTPILQSITVLSRKSTRLPGMTTTILTNLSRRMWFHKPAPALVPSKKKKITFFHQTT